MMALRTVKQLDTRFHEIATAGSMKDYYYTLDETAEDTGYHVDFLLDVLNDLIRAGEDFIESLIQVITIAYEQDF